MPLISKKGETNTSLSIGSQRVEFQASHGITKNIAFKTNGSLFIPNKERDHFTTGKGSGKFIEWGAGYFKPLSEFCIFEVYGIYGIGKVKNDFSHENNFRSRPNENIITANLRRVGIQSNIGYKDENMFFAFSNRFVNLSYQNIEGNFVYDRVDQQDYLRRNHRHFLLEPALTVGFGFDRISFRFQGGFSFNLTNRDFRQYDSSANVLVNYSF